MESIISMMKSEWIPFSCPVCDIENRCRVLDVALQARIHCRGCHETIHLVDKDASAVRTFRSTANAVDDLITTLRRIK